MSQAPIRFYHASGETPAALDALLPPLITKILSTGQQVAVVAADDARTERLNETLWTFSPTSFLPHGRLSDGPHPAQHPPSHPILLLTAEEFATHPPSPRITLFLAGTESLIAPATTLQCYLFFSAPSVLATARALYKSFKDANTTLEYYQQVGTAWSKK